MKCVHLLVVVFLLFFEDVLSQRIISRPELLEPDQQQQNQPVAARGRGRARFSVTPEFEKVQADYEKTTRLETQRSRVASPSKRITNTRRNYEVEEVLDDVPDSARKYSSRPRVVTEMRFEAINAPKDTTLFIPSETNIDAEKDELLRNSAGATESILSSTENVAASSSETGDQTTEQEMMSKELLKNSQEGIKPENVSHRIKPSLEEPTNSSMKSRTRSRKRPAASTTLNDTEKSSSPSRKEDYLRKQEVNRNTKSARITAEKRADSEPQSQVVSQTQTGPVSRSNFRSGRRRGGGDTVAQADKDNQQSVDNRGSRGPSVFQEGDLQPSRSRTGRKAVTTNTRRIPSRTASSEQVSSTTEQINRRRGKGFSREQQSSQRLEDSVQETSTFTSRRRVPVRPTTSAVPIRSRTIPISSDDSAKSETTTRAITVQPTRAINRSRSRFNPTNIDEQKLEVLPLFEAEPKTVSNRQQAFTRRRVGKESATKPDHDKKKFSEPISRPRVVVTVTETAKAPTFRPTVKESVHSEVSEVISTRKVTRPKPRGSKKAVTQAPKVKPNEEEVNESDNYPEPFKALLHKQQNGVNDGKYKSSRTRDTEDAALVDGAVSSTSLSIASDALASSTASPSSATFNTEASPSSTTLIVDTSTVSSPDENEILAIVKPTPMVRPTRRRFSLATKPPNQETTTKKPFVPSRKPTPPRPYKKYTTETLTVSLNSPTQRYHARFSGGTDLHQSNGPRISSGDNPTNYRRNFPTQSTKNARKVIQDRPERKQIPLKGNKIVDQQNNVLGLLEQLRHLIYK